MTNEEYNSCVKLYADFLYRYILKQGQQIDNAQDITQNAFEILWKNKAEVELPKAKAFLFKVAYNNMIDNYRKQSKMQYVDTFESNVRKTEIKNFGVKEILEKALNTLPDIQKQLVLLRDYEGYNYEEIGSITNLNESQVKVYIHRARLSLKNYLVSADLVI